MKIVEDAPWVNSRRSSEVSQRYDQIAEAKVGQTFVIEPGIDFDKDEDPAAIRLRYVGSLRWRGVKIRTAVRDGNVYIKVMGHQENGHQENGDRA